jgi:hypothetical protein
VLTTQCSAALESASQHSRRAFNRGKKEEIDTQKKRSKKTLQVCKSSSLDRLLQEKLFEHPCMSPAIAAGLPTGVDSDSTRAMGSSSVGMLVPRIAVLAAALLLRLLQDLLPGVLQPAQPPSYGLRPCRYV